MQVENYQLFIPGNNAATISDPVEEKFSMTAFEVKKRAEVEWAPWDYRAAVHHLISIGWISHCHHRQHGFLADCPLNVTDSIAR